MTSLQSTLTQTSSHLGQRDELVLSHLGEVDFIARRIHKRLPLFVSFEDIVSAGVLGLLDATRKYDATKNVRFKTYVQFRIHGAIIDSLRKLDPAPRRLRTKVHKLNNTIASLAMKLNREPTEDEVASETGLDVVALRELTTFLGGLESVGQQVASGPDRTKSQDLIESAPADPKGSPFAQCQRAEMRQFLAKAICNLSAKEQQVISLYYVEQLTMAEIASFLEVSRSRISQVHSDAVAKLRAYLEARQISTSPD
jgi:RNA polymerase sigma factor FliA